MPDAQRVVEEIKHLLYSAGNPLPDEVISIAADYLDLCNAANDRLRDCSRLLRRGLRSEAIQQAEQEPNLVDLVGTLDFPERQHWCQYLRQLGELLPPELLMELATELNDAYAAEQPLVKLLQHHRKLALARAPLVMRIDTLRAIAKADPANAVWQEDLHTFELARHRQMETEIGAAMREGDMAALATLESEVFSREWRNPPSDSIKETTKRGHARLRQQKAREELAALEPELTAAHAAFDIDEARRLRARWQACAELADLRETDALAELAAPALAWLAEEDTRDETRGYFDAAVYELDQLLDSGASRDELERAYYKAARYDIELPATTNVRLRERMATIDATSRRKLKLVIAGVAAGLLLLAAATTAIVLYQIWLAEVKHEAEHLKLLNDQKNVDGAREFVTSLDERRPDIVKAAGFSAELARYKELQHIEDERRASLDKKLSTAEADARFEHPTLDSLADADRQLKSLEVIAERADEKRRIADLGARISNARLDLEKRLNKAFTDKFDELAARHQELSYELSAGGLSLDQVVDQTVILESDLENLLLKKAAVHEEHIGNAKTLLVNVKAMIAHAREMRAEQQRLVQITSAVSDLADFEARLRDYSTSGRDPARKADFARAAAERPLWSVLSRWDDGVQSLASATGERWMAVARQMLADPLLSKLPMANTVSEKLPYFERVAARPSEPLPGGLKEVLDNALVAGLLVIEVREGGLVQRYYLREPPKYQPSGAYYTFKYVKNFQFEEHSHPHVSEAEIVKHGDQLAAPAPQAELAAKLRKMLGLGLAAHWDERFLEAIETTLAEQGTDPVVKLLLLKKLLEAGNSGSLAFERATQPLSAAVASAYSPSANWLLPDAAGDAERAKAAAALKGLPPTTGVRNDVQQQLAGLKKLPSEKHRWVGWLVREQANGKQPAKWACRTSERVAQAGKLIVLLQPQPDGPIEIMAIGSAKAGKLTIELTGGEPLVEGRPVFLEYP